MINHLKAYFTQKKNRLFGLLVLLLAAACFIGYEHEKKQPETEHADAIQEANDTEDTEDSSLAENEAHILTICIDAGHGGKDRGSDSRGRIEKHDCLKLAKAIQKEVESIGDRKINIILTREDDTSLSLAERCDFANDNDADYLISIHRNKGKGNGVETWVSNSASAESMAVALNIMAGLNDVGITRDRGVKIGSQSSKNEDYYINHHSKMPSCLIELGFVNSDDDNSLFDRNIKSYASAITDAILSTYDTFHTNNPQELYLAENGIEDFNQIIPTVTLSDSDKNMVSDNHTITSDDDTAKIISLFGKKQRTTHIPTEETELLDNTIIEYMQGGQTADRNRPVTSLENEAAFQKYNAHFIGTDLMTDDGKKTIYLTFNERYEYGYTEGILDVLKEHDIKAIFFVTLDYAQKNPTMIRRMINDGHVVGNFSSTNPSDGLPALKTEEQRHEILAAHTYIKKQYHYSMYLFRFPAGKYSEKSLAVVNNLNYQSIFWSFAHKDYDTKNQPDTQESLNKFISRLHPGAIYMLRGESETNSTILEEFLQKALSLGYEFCVL